MLEQVLNFTKNALNSYLKQKFDLNQDTVVINNVIEPNGQVPSGNQNKIVISLLNVEQETNRQFYGRNQKLSDGNYADINPSERFNLDLLFSSNFQDYTETLKFLGETIAFFQSNISMTRTKFPDLPEGINKLDFEIEKTGYLQMHNLWSALGAKYQPSCIYKLRLINIQTEQLIGIVPSVSATSNQSDPV